MKTARWFLSKLRGGVKCLQENGLIYTLTHTKEKIEGWLARKSMERRWRKENIRIIGSACISTTENVVYEGTFKLICPYGLGDTMIICGFLSEFKKMYKGNVVLFIKQSHIAVMEMYGIKDYVVSRFNREELFKIGEKMVPEKESYFVAHPEFIGRMDLIDGLFSGKLSFLEMYRQTLGLDANAVFEYPHFYPTLTEEARAKFQLVAPLEKTILFAPEMNASDPNDWLPDWIMEDEARRLKEKGFRVISNAISEDKVVKGTEFVPLTLTEALALAGSCAGVYSARSGFCDLVFSKIDNLTVFYPNRRFLDMYSFENVYGCVTVKERLIDNIEANRDTIPTVTVVTAVKNLIDAGRKDTFIECIESVSKQDYAYFEHLIVDGASNDGTIEILEKYKEMGWIRYVSKPDTGIYEAMNTGIKSAFGKYIVFLNSDDFFLDKSAISKSVEALEMSGADYSYAQTVYTDEKYNKHPEILQASPDIRNAILTMPFCHQTMFTRRSVLLANLFNEKHRSISDFEQFMRLFLKRHKFVYVDELLVNFRLGGMCDNPNNREMIRDELAEAYYSVFNKYDVHITKAICRQMAKSLVIPKNLWRKIVSSTGLNIYRTLGQVTKVVDINSDMEVISAGNIDFTEISVVVQGPVSGDCTRACLESIRKLLPEAEIILSTWEGTSVEGLDYDKLILNKDPGCAFDGAKRDRALNVNRWIVSSSNGVMAASRKYVLKIRADVLILNTNFLSVFDRYVMRDERYSIARHRIIIPSIYTMRYIGGHKPNSRLWTPLHVSDWYCFGLREDIAEFVTIPLINDIESFARFYENHPELLTRKSRWWTFDWVRKYAAEQYIGLQYAKRKFPNLEIPHFLDNSLIPPKLSDMIILNNFIVLDTDELGIILNKDPGYVDLCTHVYKMQNMMWKGFYRGRSFNKDYKKYFDSSFLVPDDNLDKLHYKWWYSLRFRHAKDKISRYINKIRTSVFSIKPWTITKAKSIGIIHSTGSIARTILPAKTIYYRLRKKYGEKAIFAVSPYQIDLDVQIICENIEYFNERSGEIVLIVPDKFSTIADECIKGIRVEILTELEVNKLQSFIRFIGEDLLGMKIFHYAPSIVYTGIGYEIGEILNISNQDRYIFEVFNLFQTIHQQK
jgi:glycosyltransferase involved in cell wall biosynthesis